MSGSNVPSQTARCQKLHLALCRLPSLIFRKVAQNVVFPTNLEELQSFLCYGAEVDDNLDANMFQDFREKMFRNFQARKDTEWWLTINL